MFIVTNIVLRVQHPELNPTYLVLDNARATSNEDSVHAKCLCEHGTKRQGEARTEQVHSTLPETGDGSQTYDTGGLGSTDIGGHWSTYM